jgi:hypothetical protein
LIEALGGKKPVEILRSRDYFIVYETEADVLALEPNFAALSRIDSLGLL